MEHQNIMESEHKYWEPDINFHNSIWRSNDGTVATLTTSQMWQTEIQRPRGRGSCRLHNCQTDPGGQRWTLPCFIWSGNCWELTLVCISWSNNRRQWVAIGNLCNFISRHSPQLNSHQLKSSMWSTDVVNLSADELLSSPPDTIYGNGKLYCPLRRFWPPNDR